jgi:hypothetical protein
LYDIRDYNQPLPVPPSEPPGARTEQSSNASPESAAQKPEAQPPADSDDDTITVEEWLEALLQIQQSVEDARQRAMLEAALKERLQQQAAERQKAVINALYLRAVLEEQARQEKERREQQEARRFLQVLGFNI